jgi:hypothetical protein
MKALLVAGVLIAIHLGMRALGLAEHTSAIAGMPVSPASAILGPLYVVTYLLAVVVAPILAVASVLERGVRSLRRGPAKRRSGSTAGR